MLSASDPNRPRRPRLADCPHCGANGTACDSLQWLRGPLSRCCEACPGDHERNPG